jgi:hypothetical protein
MEYRAMIEEYVQSKANSWSEKMKLNTRNQLAGFDGDTVLANDGARLYKFFTEERKLKPYSIKTYFVIVGEFVDWAMEQGHISRSFNNVKLYMKHNARLFKRVYAPQPVKHTLDEVLAKLKLIKSDETREKAGQLIRTGMRWEESFTLTPEGEVTGKGNAKRFVRTATPEDAAIRFTKTYQTFKVHLAEVGLKPHDLRKAHALWLAESGAHIGELMAFMGWRSMQSAASYLQTAKERELTAKLKDKFKRSKSE